MGARSDVELRLPADGAYAAVLRTLTAGLAARLDFTMDDIEDLRIAVSEAAAMVLDEADPGADLTCRFRLEPGRTPARLQHHLGSSGDPRLRQLRLAGPHHAAAEASVDAAPGHYAVRIALRSSLDQQ